MKHVWRKRELVILSDFMGFAATTTLSKIFAKNHVYCFQLLGPLDEARKMPYMFLNTSDHLGGSKQMSKIDLKDKRILKELFVNARTPYSIIARKVGLSKEVVHYRIKKLMDKGLLWGFNTIYNVQKLNWEIYLIYIKLRNINNEIEQDIIKSLSRTKVSGSNY